MKLNADFVGALWALPVRDRLLALFRAPRRGLVSLPAEETASRYRGRKAVALRLNRMLEATQARVPPPVGALASVALTAAVFWARQALFDGLDARFPFLLGIPTVVVCAALFGALPAVFAAAAGAALPAYFLLEPVGSFRVDDPALAFGMAVYLGIGALVALTVGALSEAKGLAVDYALERRRLHRDMQNLLHELRHRTKNELAQLMAITHMMAAGSSTEPEKEALLALGGRIRAMGHVHDMLAEAMDTPDTPVDSRAFLEGLVAKIRAAIGRDGVSIGLEAQSVLLPHTVAVPLGLVVNELVVNAFKHAFPGGAGAVSVRFRRDGGHLLLEVEDDGEGPSPCADAEPRRKGIGRRVVAGLARKLGGELSSPPGPGTRCLLRFPAPPSVQDVAPLAR